MPCGFPIKVRAEGDDISAVELLIDGRVVKQSAIAGTQLYSFTAPADLNVNRLVALRVRLQTGAGRLAAEASSSVWLRGHACWVRRTAIRERLLGEPNCPRGCVQLDDDGRAPQEKDILKVERREPPFTICATVCECRRNHEGN